MDSGPRRPDHWAPEGLITGAWCGIREQAGQWQHGRWYSSAHAIRAAGLLQVTTAVRLAARCSAPPHLTGQEHSPQRDRDVQRAGRGR
ncbi:MAG TPA: hypothetical protein DHU96_09475 [Actinobacteria bacterium]|nr:hypothetical protein [Actinomycetota bacterium]